MQVRGPILPTQPEGVNPGLATPILLRTPDTGRLVGDELKARREEDKAKRSAQTRGLGNLDVKPIKADPTLSSALNNTMASIVTDVTNRVASDPAYGDALRFLGDGVAPGFKNPESRQQFEAAVADIRSVQAAYGILSNLGQQSIKIRENVKSLYDDDTNSVITADINKFLRPDAVIDAVRNRDFETADSLVANIDPTTFVAKRKNLVEDTAKSGGFEVFKNAIANKYASGNTAALQRWSRDSTLENDEIKALNTGYTNPVTGSTRSAASYSDLVTAEFLRGKKASTYGFPETAEGYEDLYDTARQLLILREQNERMAFPPQAIIQQNQARTPASGEQVFRPFATKDAEGNTNYSSTRTFRFALGGGTGKYPIINAALTPTSGAFTLGVDSDRSGAIKRLSSSANINGYAEAISIIQDPLTGEPIEVFEVRLPTSGTATETTTVGGAKYSTETGTPQLGEEIYFVRRSSNEQEYASILNRMAPEDRAQYNQIYETYAADAKARKEAKRNIGAIQGSGVLNLDTPKTDTGGEDPRIAEFKKTVAYRYASPAKQQELLRNKRRELGLE